MRADDREFPALGEELSPFVPCEGLSTCNDGGGDGKFEPDLPRLCEDFPVDPIPRTREEELRNGKVSRANFCDKRELGREFDGRWGNGHSGGRDQPFGSVQMHGLLERFLHGVRRVHS